MINEDIPALCEEDTYDASHNSIGLTERTRTTGRKHPRQDLDFEAEAKRYSTSLNTKFMIPIKTTQVAVMVQSADTTLKSKLVYFEARFAVNQNLTWLLT